MRGWLLFIIFTLSGRLAGLHGQVNTVPVGYSAPLSVYIQNFDGLPASGSFSLSGKGPLNLSSAPVSAANCTGWQIMMTAGSAANAVFAAGTGSSTGNGVYSLGTAGSTDRALGSLAAGSGIYAIGLVLTNQTGAPLNFFTLGFTAEQWRKGGSGNKNTWGFHYKTGVIASIDQQNLQDEPRLNFSTPNNTASAAALQGNLPENQQFVTYTVTGILWKPGEQLLLRWDDADESGSDDIMGLDNLSFSAGLMSQAPGVLSTTVAGVTTSTAELSAVVNDNFLVTAVDFALDTSVQFTGTRMLKPAPEVLNAGSGNTMVAAHVDSLEPGTTYYFKVLARNGLGETVGAMKNFTTLVTPPVVATIAVSDVLTSSAVITGSISGKGITEQGVVWSLSDQPGIADHKIVSNDNTGIFSLLINSLPQGTAVYTRAFAVNAGGVSYGETRRFITQVMISSLSASGSMRTNAASVNFALRMAQPVSGLSASHFLLDTNGIQDASITSVAGSGGSFTITVNTGSGNGTIALRFANDVGLSAPVNNKPFASAGYFQVDKQAPQFRSIMIPDVPMKIGDTVAVTLSVSPETDILKITNGAINGQALQQWVKKNDSTYQSSFIIPTGGNDVPAEKDIPFTCAISDAPGNTATYTAGIHQPNDAIDANKPAILSAQNPAKGLYKMGDTLLFVYRFNERILLSGTGYPSLTLTIASRSRSAVYVSGNTSDSLLFRYVIGADDYAPDGIKIAGSVSQSNVQVKDFAGNNAVLNFTNPVQPKDLQIDAVLPVVSSTLLPINKTYRAGDTLVFIFSFSKDVSLIIHGDGPTAKLTVGNVERDLVFSKRISASQFEFTYIIKPGELDKNGITIAPALLLNGSSITDSAGNGLVPSFKTGSLANVKVDAIAPVFTTANTEQFFVCGSSGPVTISNAFAVSDDEAGELVSWKIKSMPLLGSLASASTAVTSTGKSIIPTGFIYLPDPGKTGRDSLITEITDGVNTSQKMIVVVIQPPVTQNIINSNQVVCEEKTPQPLTGSVPKGGNDQYKYSWETATDSIRFTSAPGTGDHINYSPPPLNGNTWIRRISLSGACADTSNAVKITVLKNGFWTGDQDNNWNNAANWCGRWVPNSGTNVYISSGALFQPVIRDTASCNDLSVASGARLNINGVLSLSGNIDAPPHAINAERGSMVYSGSLTQNISGDHFENNKVYNITNTNAQGLAVSGDVVCTGTIVLTKGVLFTGDHLLLQQNASIGACAGGTAFSGTIAIERPIDRNDGVQLLGHPFTHSLPLQMIGDSIPVTGEGGIRNGFTASSKNLPSAFYYNASFGNDSSGIEAGWTAFANTNGSGENAWKKYAGIKLLPGKDIWQLTDSISSKTDTTQNGVKKNANPLVRLTGNINSGDQELALPRNNYASYHVVSNPYPSNIELSRISKGRGIGNAFWVWNPSQGRHGGYTSIPFNSSFVSPLMGAFIVKAIDSINNTLLFTEQCKTQNKAEPPPLFNSDDAFFAELRLESDNIFWDRLLLIQMDSARAAVDRNDAEKFVNPDVNFYSISRDNKRLSVDARPVNNESIIPLGLQATEKGWYTIRVAKTKLPSASTLMIHDTYLNLWTSLEQGNVYTFQTTDDTLSIGDKRFEIRTREKPIENLLPRKKITMIVYPVPAKNTILIKYAAAETGNTTVRIADLAGTIIKTIPLGMQKEGQVLIPINNLLPGVYVLEARCGDEMITQKIIRQ